MLSNSFFVAMVSGHVKSGMVYGQSDEFGDHVVKKREIPNRIFPNRELPALKTENR